MFRSATLVTCTSLLLHLFHMQQQTANNTTTVSTPAKQGKYHHLLDDLSMDEVATSVDPSTLVAAVGTVVPQVVPVGPTVVNTASTGAHPDANTEYTQSTIKQQQYLDRLGNALSKKRFNSYNS